MAGGLSVDVRDSSVRLPLHQTDPNLLTLEQTGKTPLHYAALRGQDRVCKLLLDWGAEIDAPDFVSFKVLTVHILIVKN